MKTVTVEQLHHLLEKPLKGKEVLIDVRTPGEYAAEHISGAENIPLDQIESQRERLEQYDTIYVQCMSGNRSSQACQVLDTLKGAQVMNVEGGISAWKQHKYSTIKGKGVISLIRQVQIVAGGLALTGAILAQYGDPRFIWLSGFVGAGLLFAGLSGTCAMASLLSKMPWNN